MSLFRKAVLAIANAESSLPNSLVDALLPFLIYIASHSVGRNMVVGAGLIPFSLHNTNQSSLNELSDCIEVQTKQGRYEA